MSHFAGSKRLTTIQKVVGTTHVEKIRGTLQQAIDYCNKEDTRLDGPWTFGEKPTEGGRPKLAREVIDLTEEDLLDLPMHQYIQAKKIIKLHGEVQAFYEGPRKCLWIWGEPRIGKSRAARQKDPFMKELNKWWDGYQAQEVVLIDDMELNSIQNWAGHHLKRWADSHGKLTGEVKGGHVNLSYKLLIVTSNYSIAQCCPHDPVLHKAIAERFKEILMVKGDYVDDYIDQMLDD